METNFTLGVVEPPPDVPPPPPQATSRDMASGTTSLIGQIRDRCFILETLSMEIRIQVFVNFLEPLRFRFSGGKNFQKSGGISDSRKLLLERIEY
jgi:hypothetical protein